MPKVLISDKLSPAAIEIFRRRGIEVDFKSGLSPAELRAADSTGSVSVAPWGIGPLWRAIPSGPATPNSTSTEK